jgi:protein MPE1
MVNAEGDFVIAEPDKASWEQFQAKAKSSSTANAPLAENKEIREQGLECSIDKKMFIEPMKTPCCQKTFCNDCITNALIESDFVCPACQSEGVLIDDLQPDEEASKKIQEYLKDKETAKTPPPASPKTLTDAKPDGEKQEKSTEETSDNMEQKPENKPSDQTKDSAVDEKPKSPASQTATVNSPLAGPKNLVSASQDANKQLDNLKPTDTNSKKRPADDILDNPRIPRGPKAMQNQQNQQNQQNMVNGMGMNGMGMNLGMNNMMFNGMPMMPNMMGMPNMGNMNMGMPNMSMMGMPNMMGMPGFPGMNGGFGSMPGWDMGMNGMSGMNSMNGMGNMNGGMNGFQNGNFGQGAGADEDAYFRKPVNPHRHQNKQRRVRPSDYREL